jgi:hypothetical protein
MGVVRVRAWAAWGLLALAGCPAAQEEAYDPIVVSGEVDVSLAPESQRRQQAVREGLLAVQRGVDFAYFADEAPGVRWEESRDAFFTDRAVDLARWEFMGPPDGARIKLKMVFRIDERGFPEREEVRVYEVDLRGAVAFVKRVE